jgi:ADP-ribose pyrophosphatase YjhB (NUDIX family)
MAGAAESAGAEGWTFPPFETARREARTRDVIEDNSAPTREFTVAVFVVHEGRVLLHRHGKLGMWLPPGGHIEPHELPDEAAVREVEEETGVRVELLGERALDVEYPYQLVRPIGVQLEDIVPGHQHIDLIYLARPVPGGADVAPESARRDRAGWYSLEELKALGANEEIRAWCAKAVAVVGEGIPATAEGAPLEGAGGRRGGAAESAAGRSDVRGIIKTRLDR